MLHVLKKVEKLRVGRHWRDVRVDQQHGELQRVAVPQITLDRLAPLLLHVVRDGGIAVARQVGDGARAAHLEEVDEPRSPRRLGHNGRFFPTAG